MTLLVRLSALWVFTVFLTHQAGIRSAAAEDEIQWPLCSGKNPETGLWTGVRVGTGTEVAICPDGEAVFLNRIPKYSKQNKGVPLDGVCCPLPPESVTAQHSWHLLRCPEKSLITGGRRLQERHPSPEGVYRYELRCTKINDEKFQLGPPFPSKVIEPELKPLKRLIGLIGSENDRATQWGAIPPNWRYGLLRTTQFTFRTSGCLGYPWGSPLVSIGTSNCEGFYSRELLRIDGEKIPPQCSAIGNLFQRDERCVP